MSSKTSEEATKVQSALQRDRQGAGGTRDDSRFPCPIRSAHPDLRTGTKTCDNNCKGINHVKEHLRNHHPCTCPGQPASCDVLSHVGPQKLQKLKAIRRLPGETTGEQWVRICHVVSPHQIETPAPYVLSPADFKAIALSPRSGFVEMLSQRIQNTGDRGIDDTHLFLARVPHFIDLACQMGAYSNSQPAPRSTNNTRVSAAQSSMQGSVAVEHQEAMHDESDWDKLMNLETY